MRLPPEGPLALFGFLYHFVWEMWQIPFYNEMMAAAHWDGVVFCTQASIGDAAIVVMCYWGVSVFFGRNWVNRPHLREVIVFMVFGVLTTIVLEKVNTGIGRWRYSLGMPKIPLIGVGVIPIIQWVVAIPMILFTTARFLRGGEKRYEERVIGEG